MHYRAWFNPIAAYLKMKARQVYTESFTNKAIQNALDACGLTVRNPVCH